MKKRNLSKLALLGLAHGLLLNGQVSAAADFENIEALIASNPQVFAELNADAKALLSNLNNQFNGSTLMAAGCGSQCKSANPSKGNNAPTVVAKCGSNGKCASVASNCGSHTCSAVASKCGSNGKCATVASKCGTGTCSAVADRDTTKTPLQDPSKVSTNTDNYKEVDPNSENMGYYLMSEDELLLELNDEGTKIYKSLSPEGKKLAREVASQRCNGTNSCKGLNACQTDQNSCAGKGSCKGKSKCAISDKNLAVKLVAKKMAEKRNGALNN